MSFNGTWWNDGATADQDINGYTTKVTTTAEMPKLTLSSPKFSQDNNKRVPQVSMKWNRSGGTGNIQGKGEYKFEKKILLPRNYCFSIGIEFFQELLR